MRVFIKELTLLAGNIKSAEDFSGFAQHYFQNVRSRHHIIGSDYAYVTECNYNRKAFVYCMIESFSGFADNDPISSMDMLQLIESITLKFPRSVVMEAALSIENAGGEHSTSSSAAARFNFRDISSAICFHVLFEDWLKLVEHIFRDEGAMNCLSAYRVKESLENVILLVLNTHIYKQIYVYIYKYVSNNRLTERPLSYRVGRL
jgi:hypothetical protein